jgi:hypothetical protein
MSITATVENDTIKLPMHVPDGTQVEITLPPMAAPEEEPLGWMREFAGCIDTLPPDASEYHTDYATGRRPRP